MRTMSQSREDYLRNILIFHFLPQNYNTLGRGSWNLKFLVSLPYVCSAKLVKIGSEVLEKKFFKEEGVYGRRTTHDARRTTTGANPQQYVI